ncbi:MAG: hypothetical protein GY795_50585 [Desulfobacterales bacterium]|nr:hypothetical protein [Desulfobacterales bacterium]
MENLKFNIIEFINKTFQPSQNETILFMVDDSNPLRNKVVEGWAETIKDDGKLNVLPVLYHDQTGINGADLPDFGTQNSKKVFMSNLFQEADIVWSLPKYSASRPLFKLSKSYDFRAGSSPDFQLDMLDFVMTESPSDIQKRGEILLPKAKAAEGLLVEFETGHYVYFDIRNVPYGEDSGKIFKSTELGNIPFGEVYSPQHEGSLLSYLLQTGRTHEADELIRFYSNNSYFGTEGKSLKRDDSTIIETETHGYVPISRGEESWVYRIENGFVREIIGNSKTASDQREKLSRDLLWGYIAEVAFGLNSQARKDSSYTLENEKSAVHFAIGNSAQAGGFETPFMVKEIMHHEDYTLISPIVTKAKLIYKNKEHNGASETIIENGKYTIFGSLNF